MNDATSMIADVSIEAEPPRTKIDRLLDKGAALLGMCGHGPDGNWSVRIADVFFINCPCCIFWRGVAVGLGVSMSAIGLGFGLAVAVAKLN